MNSENSNYAERLVFELRQWPLLIVLAVSVLLALLIPPSVVQSIPGFSSLLDLLIENVPATRDYVLSSKFPDVAAVYFPTMLILSPLMFLYGWKVMPPRFWDEQFVSKPVVAFLKLLLTLALVIVLGFVTIFVGGVQLRIIPWNESKVALALAGFVAHGGAFFAVLASLVMGIRTLAKRIGE